MFMFLSLYVCTGTTIMPVSVLDEVSNCYLLYFLRYDISFDLEVINLYEAPPCHCGTTLPHAAWLWHNWTNALMLAHHSLYQWSLLCSPAFHPLKKNRTLAGDVFVYWVGRVWIANYNEFTNGMIWNEFWFLWKAG